jgi:acetolactate synthase-1/2/3 large subunit
MVWEDNAYGLIAWKQEGHFGKHTDLSFNNPNWEQLADSFGWHSHMIKRSSDLIPELKASFAEDGPSLIVLPIDYRENMILSERLGEIALSI